MRPLLDRLQSLPTRLWMFVLFALGSIFQIALGRLADRYLPVGQETNHLSRAVRWVADMLSAIPPGLLAGIAIGALLPWLWDSRKWLVARLQGEKFQPAPVLMARDGADDWRKRDRLELYEIACRSHGLSPILPVPNGSALSRMRRLEDAMRDGRLRAYRGDVAADGPEDGVMAQISFSELSQFAEQESDADLTDFVRQWSPPKASRQQIPIVVLLRGAQRLELHNKGDRELKVWGTKFGDSRAAIDSIPRIVDPEHFYYFLTADLEATVQTKLSTEGALVPFEIYLSDDGGDYVAKFLLRIVRRGDAIDIHTQKVGVERQFWRTNRGGT